MSDGEGSVAAEEAQSTSIHFFFGVPLLGGPLKPEHCLGMIFFTPKRVRVDVSEVELGVEMSLLGDLPVLLESLVLGGSEG